MLNVCAATFFNLASKSVLVSSNVSLIDNFSRYSFRKTSFTSASVIVGLVRCSSFRFKYKSRFISVSDGVSCDFNFSSVNKSIVFILELASVTFTAFSNSLLTGSKCGLFSLVPTKITFCRIALVVSVFSVELVNFPVSGLTS